MSLTKFVCSKKLLFTRKARECIVVCCIVTHTYKHMQYSRESLLETRRRVGLFTFYLAILQLL